MIQRKPGALLGSDDGGEALHLLVQGIECLLDPSRPKGGLKAGDEHLAVVRMLRSVKSATK